MTASVRRVGFVVHFMSTEGNTSGVIEASDVLMVNGSFPGRWTAKVERLALAKTQQCQEDWIDPLSHT